MTEIYNQPTNEASKAHLHHHRLYREAIEAAGQKHRDAVARINSDYLLACRTADAVHDATIAAAPVVIGTDLPIPGAAPQPDVHKAAGAARTAAYEAAKQPRDEALRRAGETEANEITAAKIAYRNSSGWTGFY